MIGSGRIFLKRTYLAFIEITIWIVLCNIVRHCNHSQNMNAFDQISNFRWKYFPLAFPPYSRTFHRILVEKLIEVTSPLWNNNDKCVYAFDLMKKTMVFVFILIKNFRLILFKIFQIFTIFLLFNYIKILFLFFAFFYWQCSFFFLTKIYFNVKKMKWKKNGRVSID